MADRHAPGVETISAKFATLKPRTRGVVFFEEKHHGWALQCRVTSNVSNILCGVRSQLAGQQISHCSLPPSDTENFKDRETASALILSADARDMPLFPTLFGSQHEILTTVEKTKPAHANLSSRSTKHTENVRVRNSVTSVQRSVAQDGGAQFLRKSTIHSVMLDTAQASVTLKLDTAQPWQ